MPNSAIAAVFVTPGSSASPTVPVTFVTAPTWADSRGRLDARSRAFADAAGFEPRPGRHLLLPGPDGGLAGVLFGLENADEPSKDPLRPGALPALLPAGTYRFANMPHDARLAALAFALGSYRFTRYRKADDKEIRLELPPAIDGADLTRIAEGVWLARDLINTPANDMGPSELESAARALATRHGASFRSVVGGDLLSQNFPLIHAVGRAADRAPRLIDMSWGDPAHRKITLIGKGVCFDTGGLDIKSDSRHAQHEEGHGRRRNHAGARPYADGPRRQGAAARAGAGGRERDLRLRLPSARHLPLAQGHQRRDRQHRRRGQADPGRRAGARRRGGARAHHRHGDADRRRARRARTRSGAVLHRR